MEWEDAMDVLRSWAGRDVIVVPFLEPGIALRPHPAPLAIEEARLGVVRVVLPTMAIALLRATFLEAGWIPGQQERGIFVVQGGARVDVLLDGA